jgi:GT2 family glycosyltransferase
VASIAVVIVNYNTREYLRECLAAVLRQATDQVIVVDNASSDGSAEMVRACYPSVQLHENVYNRGYGAAANQAISSCTADCVLLLNSDTVVHTGTLHALTTYLDQYPEVAIVGPRLLNPDGTLQPSCYPFPGTVKWFLHYEIVGQLIRRVPVLRDYQQRTWPHTQAQPVPWVMGAALAIRREAFEAVGGFDESFFMYCEETDLCYRLKTAGWQVHFVPIATVTHVGQASTNQYRTEMAVQHIASRLLFYKRHYSTLRFRVLAVMMRGTVFARLLFDIYRRRFVCDRSQSAGVAADIAAWQGVLLGKMEIADRSSLRSLRATASNHR